MLFSFLNHGFTQSLPGNIEHLFSIGEGSQAPLRIAVAPSGGIYLTDAFTKSISVFDEEGSFLREIRINGEPVSVAVNADNELFIGDGMSGDILKYNRHGQASVFFSGSVYPSSMEFSPDGLLYVSDSGLKTVLVLDVSGNNILEFGSDILEFPTGLALDNRNSHVLVAEHGGSGTGFSPLVKIWIFNKDGSLVKSFGSHGNSDGQFYRIQGLAVGKCGFLYAVDPYLGRISVFDEEGVFLSSFGEWGSDEGQLNLPMDIAFDSKEQILISSMNNGRIEVFNIVDSLPSAKIESEYYQMCAGESSEIEISFSGTAPWNFTYTVDGASPQTINTSNSPYFLSVSEPGLYEIISLSDANSEGSCVTGSAVIEISDTPPTAEISGDAMICEGEKADITIAFTGASPRTFNYSRNGQLIKSITTSNNPHILQVTEPGLYQITELSGGGCEGSGISGSAEIIVRSLPSAEFAEGNKRIEIEPWETAELSIELTGTPPWNIIYTIDEKSPVFINEIFESPFKLTAEEEGTYEILMVADAYCSNTSSQGYPEIVYKSEKIIPSSYMNEEILEICPGESTPVYIDFTGTPPWTFTFMVDTLMTTTIFNTYTNPYIINAIYPAVYEVTALSDAHFVSDSLIGRVTVKMNLPPDPGFDHTVNLNQVSFLNTSGNAITYVWDFGDGKTSTDENPVHTYENTGDYLVSLTASNGLCEDITISDTIKVLTVSVDEVVIDPKINIFPNPSKGEFSIVFDNSFHADTRIKIINLFGELIFSDIIHSDVRKRNFDFRSLAGGIYLLEISSDNFIDVKKIIIH